MDPIFNVEEKFEKRAEQMYEKYSEQMEALEKSPLAKAKGSLSHMDIYTVGHQLEQWESYQNVMESYNNISALGPIPKIALDLIPAIYGTSVLPLIASVQPIDEPMGMVFTEKVMATSTRGNVTAGQTLHNAVGMPEVYAVGYASEMKIGEEVGVTASGSLEVSVNLPVKPVRRDTVVIRIPELRIEATDNGKGHIFGVGCSGTINYVTGVVNLTLTADPGKECSVVADYATDFEQSGDVPEIFTELDMIPVKAEMFAIQSSVSLMASLIQGKRFGKDAQVDTVTKLTNAINNELTTSLVRKLEAAVVGKGLTQFDIVKPEGISLSDHYNDLSIYLSKAKTKIQANSGKGDINVIVGGSDFCSVIENTNKFKPSGLVGDSATFHGTYDNRITVIKAPQMKVGGNAIAMYKGAGLFESAAVYAPYLPIIAKDNVASANIMKSRSLAATMAALDVTVPNFITGFNVISSI